MGSCYIRVDTIDPFNKRIGLVSVTWDLFNLINPFN